jgi:23S rRNA (guanosine2251-2'-O)-methyltransferase
LVYKQNVPFNGAFAAHVLMLFSSTMQQTNEIYLVGINATLEALRTGAPIEKIFVRYGSIAPSSLVRLAQTHAIPITTLSHEKFDRLAHQIGATKHHQNVIALRQMYRSLPWESVRDRAATNPQALVVACDQITDPHNLGAIARTAAAVGADALMMPVHNTAPITPAAITASSGAFEHLPLIRVRSLVTTLANAKEHGWWIVGTDTRGTHLYTDSIYDRPIIVVIGSEGSGIRRSIQRLCDAVVSIPTTTAVESLNASVAAGVILFEIRRQRTMGTGSRGASAPAQAPDAQSQAD